MYIVVVEFDVKEACLASFMPLMRQNANISVSDEPGCHQFDVCFDPNKPTSVFLYEVYDDRQTFEAHLTTSHFKAFDRRSTEMISSKKIKTLQR